ncbi:hypothetical protein ACIBVK_13270 [Micromonospora echinofusca]|uniref:hypothetical protein n=1 Tax=Micromonospora echinofusca TaxID=47858 RepID=UPI000CB4B5A6
MLTRRNADGLLLGGAAVPPLVVTGPGPTTPVSDRRPWCAGPAQAATSVTFRMPGTGSAGLRVRHSPWLRAIGQAMLRADGEWTMVTVPSPDSYRVAS